MIKKTLWRLAHDYIDYLRKIFDEKGPLAIAKKIRRAKDDEEGRNYFLKYQNDISCSRMEFYSVENLIDLAIEFQKRMDMIGISYLRPSGLIGDA
ncbi:hypothetical protein CO115_01880 [Candidatus Falkowbacteria bacterium CG_4_9_14_3_um_filter_36_9]|uniref:Uncharacterized protein n=1 Tax=Candidatus Falkowbacteria bacterium CG02_land_8_20_14_3_00_36_14 TaxID=1974560 RepID=A0A2M7DR32_9BACT|nr:MAG: hypothetical protein COS18_00115 [Candidatus Falkowbacteria bacterium CG02_land_8_20_14_3_00_36_14]PIX12288.1 MAG: hypothetical protein COZ73_00485 [Candidatus Falkowbacteria bacterium CG_4_8_14_3_um_filter_36_11]PJA10647.1 MAG: hypothetical protein COX67_03960 [Candidatus Falkowbacteria bacterium CG_4_10_14_0_2_um_filter_36_22]PJB20011.1 MAG: hypothetical protein CO115_01880 [Candidatus Falkowbacteria bacterium CG_4_9_14_3_um_filter_36_9]